MPLAGAPRWQRFESAAGRYYQNKMKSKKALVRDDTRGNGRIVISGKQLKEAGFEIDDKICINFERWKIIVKKIL